MKILAIGDIHGNNDILEQIKLIANEYDKIIFIGDYVDSFKNSNREIFICLSNIIQFKKDNINKVILLKGNHDIPYMEYGVEIIKYECSGFRLEAYWDLHDLFTLNGNKKLFKLFHLEDNILFSHAGITNKWITQCPYNITETNTDKILLHVLNQFENTKKRRQWLYQYGESRGGMKHDAGGILWADKSELEDDAYFDTTIVTQVVGHTGIQSVEKKVINNHNYLYFIDCANRELLSIDTELNIFKSVTNKEIEEIANLDVDFIGIENIDEVE